MNFSGSNYHPSWSHGKGSVLKIGVLHSFQMLEVRVDHFWDTASVGMLTVKAHHLYTL